MRYIIILLVALLLFGGAAVYRCIQVAPYPAGGGQYLESPDGKLEAHASSLYDEDFWGYSRSYYEFQLVPKGSTRPIKTVRMDHLTGKPAFPMRNDKKIIAWSPDSSEATFTFQGVALTLKRP
jgi:hypothetical protein